jgi:hypothetical protein
MPERQQGDEKQLRPDGSEGSGGEPENGTSKKQKSDVWWNRLYLARIALILLELLEDWFNGRSSGPHSR